MQVKIVQAILSSHLLPKHSFLLQSVNVLLNSKRSYVSQERNFGETSSPCSLPPLQELIDDSTDADRLANKSVLNKVNRHIETDPGRLFAVIQILGKQYKVVDQDILLIERNWPPKQNDKLSFEKVLLVGGSSFTLIGRPVLPRNLVKVTGTIVHKDLTHTKMRYFYIPKERVQNLNFVREELTYIRINRIVLYPKINVLEEAEYPPSRI